MKDDGMSILKHHSTNQNHQSPTKTNFFSKHEQQRKRKLGAVKRREGEEGK